MTSHPRFATTCTIPGLDRDERKLLRGIVADIRAIAVRSLVMVHAYDALSECLEAAADQAEPRSADSVKPGEALDAGSTTRPS